MTVGFHQMFICMPCQVRRVVTDNDARHFNTRKDELGGKYTAY